MPLTRMDEEIRTHLDQRQYAEAFDLVMGRYQNKVFRLAYAMLGNRALAEEAAQDIFVRIWRALPGYRGMASLHLDLCHCPQCLPDRREGQLRAKGSITR